VNAGRQVVKALASHSDWIAAVAWHPASEHHVVTASHDASLRLWDLRAAVPLHALGGHTDKVHPWRRRRHRLLLFSPLPSGRTCA